MTNKHWIIVLVLLILGGFFVCKYFRNNFSNDQGTISLISLDTVPFRFELPVGYAVYHQEGFEGGYSADIFVGKEKSNNYFKNAGVSINIKSYIYVNGRTYLPGEYVDVLFAEYSKDSAANAKYTTLFGNKAIEFNRVSDGEPVIIGYFRSDQVSSQMEKAEHLVTVASMTYSGGVEVNKDLYNVVLKSLKIRSI